MVRLQGKFEIVHLGVRGLIPHWRTLPRNVTKPSFHSCTHSHQHINSKIPPSHEWTTSFHFHRKEIAAIFAKLAAEATFIALQAATPTLATLVSVTCMTARRHPLTVADVFTVFALVSTLGETAVQCIGHAVRYTADAVVTVKRTEAFLLGNAGGESSQAWEFGEGHSTDLILDNEGTVEPRYVELVYLELPAISNRIGFPSDLPLGYLELGHLEHPPISNYFSIPLRVRDSGVLP